ncbi:putative pleckstrin-likey domain-containing family H member 1 [Apostichopus japonicus]|uniref:Putative pleckstrin-likey domain-containing family H member 1 n=1 Tax=Stichopus japonicus TaxID=307972 RepID=A0A2G8K1H4_STIJA|nr:putative pleckstrin-likey domain-containing family H member 1 [Apostichopus japonicus]
MKNPVCVQTKRSLEKPLTSLPTDALRKEAMKLAKVDPGEHSIKQAWQLLCVTVSSFLPQQNFFELFRMHLERCSTTKTEVGRYANTARECSTGQAECIRETHPSNLEILSIIQRHPYQHMLPLSIPVHLKNDSYQVVSFDGSSTVKEFLKTNDENSVYETAPRRGSLYSPMIPVEICDVISKWEQTAKESRSAKKEVNRMMRLTYCSRLYYPVSAASETEKERQLLAYQTMEDIVDGRFPVNRELALELAAVMAQAEYGDYQTGTNKAGKTGPSPNLRVAANKYYPKRYKPVSDDLLKRWPFFGAKLFSAKYKSEELTTVWLAVQDTGISFLDYKTLRVSRRVPLNTVVTFGGIKDDFMLVLRQQGEKDGDCKSEKIILIMTKPKILEIIGLIASYMHQEPVDRSRQTRAVKQGATRCPKYCHLKL